MMNMEVDSGSVKLSLSNEHINDALILSLEAQKPNEHYLTNTKRQGSSSSVSREVLIIAFKISLEVKDWYHDDHFGETDVDQSLFPSLKRIGEDRPAKVNKAILQKFKDLLNNTGFKDEVEKAVKVDKKKILFTGHLYGGALACFATLWMLETYIRKQKITFPIGCVTFGSPLIGNETLSHAVCREKWSGHFTHFVMEHDMVPRIMLAPKTSIQEHLHKILQHFLKNLNCTTQKPSKIARLFSRTKLEQTIDTDQLVKPDEAAAFFEIVLINASNVASHDAYDLMEPTSTLKEKLSVDYVKISPYRPFGEYVFCTCDETQGPDAPRQQLIVENPNAVLQLLFCFMQLPNENQDINEFALNSLAESFGYEDELNKNGLQLQNMVKLKELNEKMWTSNRTTDDVVRKSNKALFELAQAATVESCPVSMALFGQSQSVDSAYREKSSCSGPRSVLSTDQNEDLLRNKVSFEPPTVSFSGESRYLTPLWVSRNEEPLNEHYEIIRAVLKQLVLRAQHVLVQFWSPLVVGKHQLLTTLDQPFGLGLPVEELYVYRKESERNLFLVCMDDEERDISPPARVFRRGLPEWTSDLTNYLPKHFPQQDCAIRCNLHGYLALPIFDPTTALCIGVLELLMSSKNTDYTFEIQQVHKALKLQNLTCPQTFDCATPQVLSERRQNVWDKIYCFLKSVCDIHNLPLAQTWAVSPLNSFVSHEKALQKSCSSFDTKCIGKVCMSTTSLPFYVRDMGMWPFREACKMQHLDKSCSFVGKALLAHGSSYCEDVTGLSEEDYPLVHNARMIGLRDCFTIFLHSVEGDDDDYVLEFFLPLDRKDSRHVLNLVQTLKQMIVMASGFELGEISPIEITVPPRDASYLSLSIEPQSIQISSTTTAKTLAFGMDSINSVSVLASVAKSDSADIQSQCSSKENYTNDMSDNVNIVNSRENDNAASYSIVTNQNPSDTITDAGEKSKKRGRKRKIDSLTMEAVVQHVGKPISQAAESLGVSRSTLKRFCRENGILSWPKPCHSKKTSYATESKSDSKYQVPQLMVKATFKGDMIKFRFPISSGLLELENEVAQRLDLKGKRLIIKYKDEENDWLSITCDDDLHNLPEFLASNTTIKLLVELASN